MGSLAGEGLISWNSKDQEIQLEQKIKWFPSPQMQCPQMEEINEWKLKVDEVDPNEDCSFFSGELEKSYQEAKAKVLEKISPSGYDEYKKCLNVFEAIDRGFFINRSAMKMANMDAVFDWMFTEPKDENGVPIVEENQLLYFADVCGGPGGFAEYILCRKRWLAKGFGITLKCQEDYEPARFISPIETFEPHYGVNGYHGNGDIYDPENILEFRRHVLSQTQGKGVHFMMADGAFDAEEHLKENVRRQLDLCQVLLALYTVRTGGHFVVNIPINPPFAASLIYLIYRTFKCVSIHKPNMARPSSSERFIICKHKRDGTEHIADYLFEANRNLIRLKREGFTGEFDQLVPVQQLLQDRNFYDHLVKSNNSLIMRRKVFLEKIYAFYENPNLREDRMLEVRSRSLSLWKIPDEQRLWKSRHSRDYPRIDPTQKAIQLMDRDQTVLNDCEYVISTLDALETNIKSVYDWNCVVVASDSSDPMHTFYLGLGDNNVFFWDDRRIRWEKFGKKIEMAADTLIYAELVEEGRVEGDFIKGRPTLHIIDAMYLGGIDVGRLQFEKRLKKCLMFAEAMNKASRPDLVTIRVKQHFPLAQVGKIFERIVNRNMKINHWDRDLLPVSVFDLRNDQWAAFIPNGLLIYKETRDPWTVDRNSVGQRWVNRSTKKSLSECPAGSIATFSDSHKKRLLWPWTKKVEKKKKGWRENVTRRIEKEDFISFVAGMTK